MKKITNYLAKYLIYSLLLLSSCAVFSQEEPFSCDYNAYLFQFNDVYSIDLASGNSYLVASDITSGNINAAAYNPADGYIWGYLNAPSKTIVRIGKNFTTTSFYIAELPGSNQYVGDVSASGSYYLKGGGTTYYKIDLNPNSNKYTEYISTETLSKNISVHDWAFNANDGYLYTVEKGSNLLYRIDATTGTVTSLGIVPILSGLNYTYGAVYFDASGNFYVSANETGTIYIITNVQNYTGSNMINSNLFAFGPSSSSNDGARCPTAPVPQEDCTNGIDDDGDGLIDCEDPSCSGYASCPIIVAPVSGGNDGGLESNNRLADQINKRNFNRAKNNYQFDKSKAKRLVKSNKYALRNSNSNFILADFVPLTTINEDYVLETTPTDLLGITNATDVYSVDYMKNNISVASILAIKTENGVYEHTKYICDRLLGAELISVSTIEINDQSFIKSIIKNADGTTEFVLSLSAKQINNDTNFAIESHWNLDQYESNVTFYNFQIWSNSIDDLYKLGSEVVSLLDTQRPITSYNNSTPPTVFVRKGKYTNAKLELQVINSNGSNTVTFDAGIRTSETNSIQNVSSTINLAQNYITEIEINTGNLFDVGFRIGDGIATPDDLFMSDGPWGIDDSAPGTTVTNYTVSANNTIYDINEFPIERNVVLKATTNEYVAAYRAITPRFKAVDLSDYNSFKLSAKGTGNLDIRFVKSSIDSWENQFKTTIQLTNEMQDFAIPFKAFTSLTGEELLLNDIKTIVFTMVSENGTNETKEMNLQAVRFSKEVTKYYNESDLNDVSIYPNPMSSNATFNFVALNNEEVTLYIYNQLGKVVKEILFNAKYGPNEVLLEKENLSSGIYFCKIVSQFNNYKSVKLVVK